jgi:hypothetical protein
VSVTKPPAEQQQPTAANAPVEQKPPAASAVRNEASVEVEGSNAPASPPPAPVANSPALISMEKPASQPALREGRFRTALKRGMPADVRSARKVETTTRQPQTGRWEQQVPSERVEAVRSRDAKSSAVPGRIVDSREGAPVADSSSGGSRPVVSRPNAQPDRHLLVGIISRGDHRFNKVMTIMDGLSVKLRDTDDDPLDADLEIVAGKFKISANNVPAGNAVKIRGVSQRQYKLTILWIDHERDTVKFAVDRAE